MGYCKCGYTGPGKDEFWHGMYCGVFCPKCHKPIREDYGEDEDEDDGIAAERRREEMMDAAFANGGII